MDPELLPRQKLMSLCLAVIGTMELDLQQKASTALLKLAACANGEQGAATATSAEILELLKALESPCSAVREASLQVRLLVPATVQVRLLVPVTVQVRLLVPVTVQVRLLVPVTVQVRLLVLVTVEREGGVSWG